MKKLPSLHILNGDASSSTFEKADFPGQVVIWREILSEGPAIGSLPEQEFWKKRQQYITETYSEKPEEYKLKVLDVVEKLNIANAFFEVILWFDADMMCQINLLYLLQKLSILRPAVVSVCIHEEGKNLATLSPEELHHVFENRQVQSEAQLQQAHQVWHLYAGPDPLQLQLYLQQHDILEPYLAKALELHLQRFPDCEMGLGKPESEVISIIKAGATTEQQVLQNFWQRQPYYGYGDWQLLHIIKRLQPELVQLEESLKLTPLGEAVLNGKQKHIPSPQWLGGAFLESNPGWCYSKSERQLKEAGSLAPNVQ